MYEEAIANPEIMTPEEWKLYQDYTKLFQNLIKDLKEKNYLKHIREIPENHPNILETFQRFTKGYNMMIDTFYGEGKMKSFVERNKDFGVTEKEMPNLFVSQVIAFLIISSESFRNNLLAIIRWKEPFRKKMGLGELLTEIRNISPNYGKQVKDLLDTKLRNALVHGTFWIDGDTILYCNDMRLIKPSKIKLFNLLQVVKKTNVINTALFAVMVNYGQQGFFARAK